MWLLAGGLFVTGKAAVLVQARRRGGAWPAWRTIAWLALWPGMNPRDFDEGGRADSRSFAFGLFKIAVGALLLWGVARRFENPLAAGWCGMIGLILMMHLGVFEWIAIFWQARGLRAAPIMNAPIASLSVAEFWGRRWNGAFRDLAHPFFFKPAARRFGLQPALWISFAVSGLAHELVISVPAGAGFGLPTAYFLLQALGITIEKRAFTHSSSRIARWVFTHSFTALPAFCLFHPPFVERVMVPFFHAIKALP